jgi:hypothetical protein
METEDDAYETSLEYGFQQLMDAIIAQPALCVNKSHELWKDLRRVTRHLFSTPDENDVCHPTFSPNDHAARWNVFCLSTGRMDAKLTTRVCLLQDAIQTAKDAGNVIPFDPSVLKQVSALLKRIQRCEPIQCSELRSPEEDLANEMLRVERGLRAIRKGKSPKPVPVLMQSSPTPALAVREPERFQFGLYVKNREAFLIGRDAPNFYGSTARFTDALWDLCLLFIRSDASGVSRDAAENAAGVSGKTFNKSTERVRTELRETLGVTVKLNRSECRYYVVEVLSDP